MVVKMYRTYLYISVQMVVKMYRTYIIYFSSNGCQDVQNTFFYQLIMEKDERLVLPTTQQLFELSFLQMGIKLQEVHLHISLCI